MEHCCRQRVTTGASPSQRVASLLLYLLSLPAFASDGSSLTPTILGDGVSLGRQVIASGGGDSSGGNFTINGTVGQADVDPLQPSTGGAFSITGGFWFTAAPRADALFGNGFEAP